MGSASRPHRRARSAKVLYKDSASENEADENFSIAHQSISSDRVRKNLTLKRVSRSQERAEALQIQKAIEESLSQDPVDVTTGRVSLDAVDDAKEVVDSEEEGFNVPGSITNEAGLQNPCAGSPQDTSESISRDKDGNNQAVLDEIPVPSIEVVHGDEQSSEKGFEGAVNPGDIKSLRSAGANKKILKAVVEKDEDWSCEEEDGDDDDEEDDEGMDEESSDASEGLKYKRKRPVNSQKKGRKAAGHTGKEQKAFSAQVKKPRSLRTISEAKGLLLSAKKGIPSNGHPMKQSTQPKPWDSEKNNLSSTISEASKKHVMDSKEINEPARRGALLKGCKSAFVENQKSPSATLLNKASLLENASCESSGILSFPAQSPTGLHRRVLGLSRRFKPPPLHPYLPKMEG